MSKEHPSYVTRLMKGLAGVVVLALVAGCGLPANRGTAQSHSLAGRGAKGGHRWSSLSPTWQIPHVDDTPHYYGLGTDGRRVFVVQQEIPTSAEAVPAEVTAYDGGSGARRWTTTLPWIPQTTPVAGNGVVVFATRTAPPSPRTAQAAVYVGLDTATGKPLWRRTVRQPIRPPVGHDTPPGAFFDGLFYYADGARLIGVDPRTGAARRAHTAKTVDIVFGPVAFGSHLAVITRGDVDRGGEWQEYLIVVDKTLAQTALYTFAGMPAIDTLAAEGDVLVAGQDNEGIWAVDAGTGKQLWHKELPEDLSSIGPPVNKVVPVLRVFPGGGKGVVAYDVRTGRKLWELGPKEGAFSDRRLQVADGTLFSLGHDIEIIDTIDGKVLFDLPSRRGGISLTAAAGKIIAFTHDGLFGLGAS
ncbi:MAG: PQQ-binding-like beta-propeller repeat protein [Thermobispora bispora]|nr:PQQ-binding-like beta-propeller repeat protein [Thermobispora bispora]